MHGDPLIKADDITQKVFDFADEIVFGKVRQRPDLPEVKPFLNPRGYSKLKVAMVS